MKDNGQFKPNHTPWNKGKEGIHLSPETEIKEGQWVGEGHPSWKGGIQKPKNDCVHLWDGNGKRVRRPKKVYEENFGPVPEGCIVIHLDGNKDNDDPSNLKAITRAELLKRNRA